MTLEDVPPPKINVTTISGIDSELVKVNSENSIVNGPVANKYGYIIIYHNHVNFKSTVSCIEVLKSTRGLRLMALYYRQLIKAARKSSTTILNISYSYTLIVASVMW